MTIKVWDYDKASAPDLMGKYAVDFHPVEIDGYFTAVTPRQIIKEPSESRYVS